MEPYCICIDPVDDPIHYAVLLKTGEKQLTGFLHHLEDMRHQLTVVYTSFKSFRQVRLVTLFSNVSYRITWSNCCAMNNNEMSFHSAQYP